MIFPVILPDSTPDEAMELIRKLEIGLQDLLNLTNHYADLLNMYDNGERVLPKSWNEWLNKLEEKR